MRIALVNVFADPALTTPESVLRAYWHVPQLAAALAGRGHAITIVQVFHTQAALRYGDVDVVMTRDARRLPWTGRGSPAHLSGVIATLEELRPQVIHLFGLTLLRPLAALTACAGRIGARVSVSFHGGAPRRNPIARAWQRKVLANVAAIFFSTTHYAEEWQRSGVIRSGASVVIAPEVSSPLIPIDRNRARVELGLDGELLLAWSGRLHPIKDPLTALRGFELLAGRSPDARMLMCFRSQELIGEVTEFLECRPRVRDRVTLLGEWPHERMAVLFSAADFFVQSSLREFGGNSLVEAMSCGAIPVVTDIPSFRALTDEGRLARLFAPGDAAAMAQAITTLAEADRPALAARIRGYFDEQLSYPALARLYESAFTRIVRPPGSPVDA